MRLGVGEMGVFVEEKPACLRNVDLRVFALRLPSSSQPIRTFDFSFLFPLFFFFFCLALFFFCFFYCSMVFFLGGVGVGGSMKLIRTGVKQGNERERER